MKWLIGTLFLILSGSIATAQFMPVVPCAERSIIIKQLEQQFSEAPISMGLTNDGSILEIFVSRKRTFTVIVTRPDGVSCLISSGGYWENLNLDFLKKGHAL